MQYQLIYNGHPANPLLNTLEEAEQIKQRAAISMPEIMVEIVTVREEGNV
tara:strand:- start:340 stop:489 length:150 start_codon:yes stop_codon:yes gene_type:complete